MLKRLFVIIFTFCVGILPVTAKETFYDNSYFNIVNGPSTESSQPMRKLYDGNILIGVGEIYNPKSNTVTKTGLNNEDYNYVTQVVGLDENNFLILRSMKFDLFKKFLGMVDDSVRFKRSQSKEEYYKYYFFAEKLSDLKSNRHTNMNYEQRTKVFEEELLPYIKSNENLNKEFEKYIKDFNDFQYAQEYNLTTKKLKNTSKRNYRLKIEDAVRLTDGRVLLNYYPVVDVLKSTALEVYDPKTKKFNIVQTPENYRLYYPILLNDGRVLFANAQKDRGFVFYNPANNTFTESKLAKISFDNWLKLRDGNILIFDYVYSKEQNINQTNVYIYDPINDIKKYIGNLSIPRTHYGVMLLAEDKVLVYKGFDQKRSGFFMGAVTAKPEIYNLKTNKSVVFDDYEFPLQYQISLNDGRIMFLGADRRIRFLVVK